MSDIFYANQEKLIHKPRHPWSAEVIQKSNNHKGITIVKRVPLRRKNNILLATVISYGLKREGCLLKKIMRGAPGISPKVIFCEKDSIIMEKIKGESLYACRDRVRGKAEVYNRLKKTILKLHSLSISHGEIRSGSIIINTEGDVFLIDFTLSVWKDNLLFKMMATLDLLALAWIKKNIFRLDLGPEELSLRVKSPLITAFFDKFIAKDINYS